MILHQPLRERAVIPPFFLSFSLGITSCSHCVLGYRRDCLMEDAKVSDATPSSCQDNVIPPLSTNEHEDHREIANPLACKHDQFSSHSFTLSMIKRFVTSFFIPKKEKSTSTNSVSPSETTPLLVPQTSSIENHELRQRNASSSILWNEVKTLTKYALPVFGFVGDSPASRHTFSLRPMLQVRLRLSIVYSCPR